MRIVLALLGALTFSTPALAGPMEDLKAVNDSNAAMAAGDLRGTEQRMRSLEDPNLRQTWLSNISLSALGRGDCRRVRRLVGDIVEPNLKKIWQTNLAMRC